MMIPSLSVDHTVPSRRQKRSAGALFATEAERSIEQPGTNHLNPTGTSTSGRCSLRATRSMIVLLTMVLPIAACAAKRDDG
jgi:hypothetical protein